jgi:hypothetical protein
VSDWLQDIAALGMAGAAIALLLLAVGIFEVSRFNECRRVHPAWYCLTR